MAINLEEVGYRRMSVKESGGTQSTSSTNEEDFEKERRLHHLKRTSFALSGS